MQLLYHSNCQERDSSSRGSMCDKVNGEDSIVDNYIA